ncbi:fructosamine kinase family protein [soil metagenome]
MGDHDVVTVEPVAGGSINDAFRAELESGDVAFVKSRDGARIADFEAEAAGLRWLGEADVRVPAVLEVGRDDPWLALEWIEPGSLSPGGAEELGQALAALHRAGANAHGALPPGSPDRILRLGSVEVELSERESWSDVYADVLLRPLVARAIDAERLDERDAGAIAAVSGRIAEVAGDPEDPSRLHGDLWGGNVLAASDGRAWLIDAAAYGGHREIDLAMLRLFGAPSDRIFAAYEEAYPLADGHNERVALWQILPLIVHAILFGGAYGRSAGDAARRFL